MTVPALDRSFPALIFKASRNTIHHGTLGIARTLGRLGVPVYAVVEDRHTPLAASRYVEKAFVWERWPDNKEAFLSAMSALGELIDRPTILFPADDLSAISVAENASALSRWFRFPQLRGDLPRNLADKANFYSLCSTIGVSCARSVVPRSVDDVHEFIEHTTFPIVLKAATQWRLLGHGFNVKMIQTRGALLEFCNHHNFEQDPQFILQEYIPGKDWIYHGYSNSDRNLYISFTGKKVLDYPPGAGATALGASCRNDVLRSKAERLLREISYSGISDMDWRQDERDGQYKIMDCNPRVGMNFRMFESAAGIDVVRAQHLDLTGHCICDSKMIEDRLLTVEFFYLLSSIRGGRRALTRESGSDPLPRSRELAWWSRDDKLPFFAVSPRFLFQIIRRTLQVLLSRLWCSRVFAS
jgi:predicted ATP-grasp superfamily ATP-dependent carboligase